MTTQLTPREVPLTRSRYDTPPGVLTPRQRQVLGMFCSGWTYTQIASALGLSPGTINPSLRQSAARLGCPGIGREKLRAYAAASGNLDEYALP